MDTVELQINIWVDSYTGEYILQDKQPNRGLLMYSSGETITKTQCTDYGIGDDGNPA